MLQIPCCLALQNPCCPARPAFDTLLGHSGRVTHPKDRLDMMPTKRRVTLHARSAGRSGTAGGCLQMAHAPTPMLSVVHAP